MTPRLRHYVCGSTSHGLSQMFRGEPAERRQFPSGVFLYEDADRRVLFDTGYATGRWQTGAAGAVYRRLLPPVVDDADDVEKQLRADGVDPASISHVVLSHLHPDHIGGVRRFPNARFLVSAQQLQSLAAPRLREGILRGLLPEWFPGDVVQSIGEADLTGRVVNGVHLNAADPFGDGRYLLVDLPGHAAGHLGALIDGQVLIAGDAAWGADLLGAIPRMRAIPRAVQHDFDAYQRTGLLLAELAEAGIRIVCSHDPLTDRELLS